MKELQRVNNYRVKIDGNGNGELYVYKNNEEIYVGNVGNVNGKDSAFVNNLALMYLANNGIEVSNTQDLICDYGKFMQDKNADMEFIRNHMRKIVKELDRTDISREEMKEEAFKFQAQIMACKTIADTYKIDIAYNRVKPIEIIEIKK